jgi:hypothetical protein
MDAAEETAILAATGCPQPLIDTLLVFAEKYRQSMSADNVLKNRKLGTRSLVRIARRLALYPQNTDLQAVLRRSLLAEFLPATEKMNLNTLLEDSNIFKSTPPVRFITLCCHFVLMLISCCSVPQFNPSPYVQDNVLIFPAQSSTGTSETHAINIPLFDPAKDPDGAASHIPHMDHFYDNSLQTGLMRDIAIDLEVLGEHIVLLGNQVR